MNLMKIFSKKRDSSEYLKYEDGEIISIGKVSSNPDNAPRLEVEENIANNIPTVNKQPKGCEYNNTSDLDKKAKGVRVLKLVVGGLLLVSLFGYVVSLSLSFINKTQNYVSDTQQTTQQTSQVAQKQQDKQSTKAIANTTTNTTNIASGQSKTDIKQNTEPQPINSADIANLLETISNAHGIIYSSINQSKLSIVSYTNGKTSLTVISSQMNRNSLESQQLYTSIQSKKNIFNTYNAQGLYNILLQRLENNLDLSKNIVNVTNSKSMVSILNDHIAKENNFLGKQNTELKSFLDKNAIKYTNNNGQISWTISSK